MRRVVYFCAFVCLIEAAFGQVIGCNGLTPGVPIPNGLALGNGIAANNLALNNGLANSAAAVAANLPGMPISTVSPTGYGDVTIAGELPVGGSTAVVGNVPIIGFVTFEGIVPAGGMVSLASNCECNPLQ